jgi:hypothetical protein
MKTKIWADTETSGLTPQNRYIIGVDPGHKDGDYSAIWIKSPSDDIMEMMKPMDREYMNEVILKAFGVPKKYWSK